MRGPDGMMYYEEGRVIERFQGHHESEASKAEASIREETAGCERWKGMFQGNKG